ncbi:MAG TPA: CapA family protein, partial [Anaerolineae bacterium]|nr:CapA family protein [Anaerolineae bacterium]
MFWLMVLCLFGCQSEPVTVTPQGAVGEVTVTSWPTAVAPTAPATAVTTPTPIPPTISPTATTPPTLSPTPTPIIWRVGAVTSMPADIIATVQQQLPPSFQWETDNSETDLLLTWESGSAVGQWQYALVTSFDSVIDEVSLAELQQMWQDGELWSGAETNGWLQARWGSAPKRISESLSVSLWQEKPALGIIPFEELTPNLKVLRVDGVAPIDVDFGTETVYALTLPLYWQGEAEAVAAWQAFDWLSVNNFNADQITHVAMTGAAGLDRAVGDRMERKGVTYPGEAIAPLMESVDFAHMSNEVAFAPNCPYPEPVGDTQFCARDKYLELLLFMGIDIVELTGNHVNDWGEHNFQHTLDLYEEVGILTFGGGRDLEAAKRPLQIEHNGNRIAFVGCNVVGPYYAFARQDYGGSWPCGDYTGIKDSIATLADEGYLVIATMQYQEGYEYITYLTQQGHFHD